MLSFVRFLFLFLRVWPIRMRISYYSPISSPTPSVTYVSAILVIIVPDPNDRRFFLFCSSSTWARPRWKNPGARSRPNGPYRSSSTPWLAAPSGRHPKWCWSYRTEVSGSWTRLRGPLCVSTKSATSTARVRTRTTWTISRTSPRTITPVCITATCSTSVLWWAKAVCYWIFF